ncbi:IS3 family transposase [bacterium]|nr:IS3 family transposase [bacterium]
MKKEKSEQKQGALLPDQRWSSRRKREVVLRLLRGEPLEAVGREVGVETCRLEKWRERAPEGIDLALKDRTGDPLQTELDAAKRHIGEVSMENELLRRQLDQYRPFGQRRSRK